MRARVVVVAGPSGSGKSRLAARTGLPVLRLDDFYKDGGDPTLPRIADGPNAGIADWDDPESWLCDDAVAAIETLCREGAGDVPVYELAKDGRTGWQRLDLHGSPLFVAEGIFAQEVVPRAREAGLLADAVCVRQHPMVTFWRRLTRDLRERRKPPLVLVRRGLALMRAQREVVRHAVALGCRPVTPDEALQAVASLSRSGAVER
ncbi:uridine kinase [Nocardioides marinquilinus]|uniref:Uridine kinase n=1 Tax=Nocardioides marinquilinus TaxID=1210400 RepID=A0ABP9PKZ6_9ACTN